ncbi:MAG: hypothetical protein JWR27_852 [Aeromicrobium sp.]|nr:hypothetical protein [Aeromicrobium sp.]
MRRFVGVLVALLVVCSACSGNDDKTSPGGGASAAKGGSITLASLDLDWPAAGSELDAGKRPGTPAGFDEDTLDEMASILTDWAQVAAVDGAVWHGAAPIEQIADAVPAPVAKALRARVAKVVSPRLSVANVFGDDVTVVGSPRITTAWDVSKQKDKDGKTYALLELQTRTAYEVRLDDGASRVIGMLRVQGLYAYQGATDDDFGVSFGWQEFGAGDCALALDDELVPDSDVADAKKDLAAFVKVGNGKKLDMPPLPPQEQVDDDYLNRCRNGSI